MLVFDAQLPARSMDNTVEEVGVILEYADERAFRRAFKRLTGKSPARYRRMLH